MAKAANEFTEDGGQLKLPDLQDVIEEIGLGPAQFAYCLIGGAGLWFADGAEMLVVSGVTKTLTTEWSLGSWGKGLMTICVYVGMLLGNFSSGTLGDNYGRRHVVLLSYAGLAVFSFTSAFASDITMLGIFRVFLGIAMGLGMPAWTSLSTELTSAYWRYAFRCIVVAFWSFGEMFACMMILIDDPTTEAVHWRRLFQVCAIFPLFLLIIGSFHLPQSPSWLAVQGRYEEATQILEEMRDLNGRPHINVNFELKTPRPSSTRNLLADISHQLKVLYNKRLRLTTGILTYCSFVAGFTYYGGLYAFPQVFAAEDSALGHAVPPAMQLFIGAFFGLPGVVLALLLGMNMRRKSTMCLSAACIAASALFFTLATEFPTLPFRYSMAQFSYWGIKSFSTCKSIVATQYASEVYPTEARITGVALYMSASRIGAILAPGIFEMFVNIPYMFFGIMALLNMIAVCLMTQLPYETSMAKLLDKEQDDEEDLGYGTTSK